MASTMRLQKSKDRTTGMDRMTFRFGKCPRLCVDALNCCQTTRECTSLYGA